MGLTTSAKFMRRCLIYCIGVESQGFQFETEKHQPKKTFSSSPSALKSFVWLRCVLVLAHLVLRCCDTPLPSNYDWYLPYDIAQFFLAISHVEKTHSGIFNGRMLVLSDTYIPRKVSLVQKKKKSDSETISNFYPKYFFALCRTRVSNTWLLIGLCAVWKGFNIV